MANTYTLISSSTVGAGGASSISFTSIPSTYTDLKVVLSARSSTSTNRFGSLGLRFNSATTNYSDKDIYGNGATAASQSNVYTASGYLYLGEVPSSTATASTFGNVEVYIPNYTGATYKSISVDSVQEDNQTTAYATLVAGLWSSTAAITQIDLYAITYNFLQYSTAYLYGIKNS